MTTGNIPVNPAVSPTEYVPTYTFTEDSITKNLERVALNEADGSDTGLAAKLGVLTETAPTTDIASSGLNGRLQRIAIRLTTLITNLGTFAFGAGTAAAALRVTLPSDGPVATALGTPADAAVLGDVNGSIIALLRGMSKSRTIKSVPVNLTADTDIIAAVTSKRIKVIAYSLTSIGTNQDIIMFKSNGTGGTEVARIVLQGATAQPYGANQAIDAPSFLFATLAGEKLTLDVNQTDGIMGFITYFDDDAT